MEVIRRHVITRSLPKRLKDLDAFHDFSYGERREPVEVNDTLLRLLGTFVALWPFLDVTIEAYCRNVASRHQITVLTIRHQIAERQVSGIGMVHQLTEAYREGAYRGRHQDI